MCTCSVRHKSSYFHAQFKTDQYHRGKKRAYVAVAHSDLNSVIYHILKDGVKYQGSWGRILQSLNAAEDPCILEKVESIGMGAAKRGSSCISVNE